MVSISVGEYFYCVLTINPTAVTLFRASVVQGPSYPTDLLKVWICLVLCKNPLGDCHESASAVR